MVSRSSDLILLVLDSEGLTAGPPRNVRTPNYYLTRLRHQAISHERYCFKENEDQEPFQREVVVWRVSNAPPACSGSCVHMATRSPICGSIRNGSWDGVALDSFKLTEFCVPLTRPIFQLF